MIRDEEEKMEKKPHAWLFLFLSFPRTVLDGQPGEGKCKMAGKVKDSIANCRGKEKRE